METFLGQLTHLAEVLHTPLGWGNCDAFVYAWVNLARETLFKMLTSLRKLAWAGVEEAWFMDEGVD